MKSKFSLEWVLNIKKTELSQIELNLSEVNSKLNSNIEEQNTNTHKISVSQDRIYSCSSSWEINSIIRTIEYCEQRNIQLTKECEFLNKEKEMILNKYNTKSLEIKALEIAKSNFLLEHRKQISIKEEQELSELAILMMRKEEH